jgi:hypothetical protein
MEAGLAACGRTPERLFDHRLPGEPRRGAIPLSRFGRGGWTFPVEPSDVTDV